MAGDDDTDGRGASRVVRSILHAEHGLGELQQATRRFTEALAEELAGVGATPPQAAPPRETADSTPPALPRAIGSRAVANSLITTTAVPIRVAKSPAGYNVSASRRDASEAPEVICARAQTLMNDLTAQFGEQPGGMTLLRNYVSIPTPTPELAKALDATMEAQRTASQAR